FYDWLSDESETNHAWRLKPILSQRNLKAKSNYLVEPKIQMIGKQTPESIRYPINIYGDVKHTRRIAIDIGNKSLIIRWFFGKVSLSC
ncbi:hypothetical protein HZS_3234, partial [Henneguya salminicola]